MSADRVGADEEFARGTDGLVDLTPGDARLVHALEQVVDAARAMNRGNRAHATRADHTGHRLDAQRFTAVANAAQTIGRRVEEVLWAARRGEFS